MWGGAAHHEAKKKQKKTKNHKILLHLTIYCYIMCVLNQRTHEVLHMNTQSLSDLHNGQMNKLTSLIDNYQTYVQYLPDGLLSRDWGITDEELSKFVATGSIDSLKLVAIIQACMVHFHSLEEVVNARR